MRAEHAVFEQPCLHHRAQALAQSFGRNYGRPWADRISAFVHHPHKAIGEIAQAARGCLHVGTGDRAGRRDREMTEIRRIAGARRRRWDMQVEGTHGGSPRLVSKQPQRVMKVPG